MTRQGLATIALVLGAALSVGCGKYGPPSHAGSAASRASVSAGPTAAEDCEDDAAAKSATLEDEETQP